MGFFNATVKPTLPVASIIQSNKTDLPFSAGDVLADWTEFNVPKAGVKLCSITLLIRGENGAAQISRDIQVLFAKSDTDGTAPATLGNENGVVSQTTTWQNNVIAHQLLDITTMTTRLTNMTVATTGASTINSLTPGNVNVVLQGEPLSDKGGAVKLYVGLVGGATNTWDFATGVILNDASDVAVGDTVLTVDGVDARIVFAPGDVILKHDSDTAVGTVKSVDSATQITLVSGGSGVAISDDDELVNSQPITIVLGFEY